MSERRNIITIDGLSASGKTSIARALAQKLGWFYFSSGLLYRAVGFLALEGGVDLHSEQSIAQLIAGHRCEVDLRDGISVVSIDGVTVATDLQEPKFSEAASIVAQYGSVRAYLIAAQRNAFPGVSLVAEGRDMGSVIFPNAEVKFFIDAPLEVRVTRRLEQFVASRPGITAQERRALEESMRTEIADRDERDTTRANAPVTKAADAHLIDNSRRPLELVLEEIVRVLQSYGLAAA